jgi:hypothetical protein
MSVVPERGIPTMKIGTGPSSGAAAAGGGTLAKIDIRSAVLRLLCARS